MEYFDILDEDNIVFISGLMERVDENIFKSLKECKGYCELENQYNDIMKKYRFVDRILCNGDVNAENYTKQEMEIIVECLNVKHKMENYESFEMYKQGMRDCYNLIRMLEE